MVTGSLLGISKTVVNPPAAAAAVPEAEIFFVCFPFIPQVNMLINQAWQNQQVVEVGFLVGVGHLGFFADFLDFAFFDGYAAVDDLPVEVGFGVCEDRINNQGGSRSSNSGWFG